MTGSLLSVYEAVGTAIARLEPYLSVTAVLLFVSAVIGGVFSRLFSPSLHLATIWVGGFAVFGRVFSTRRNKDGTGAPSFVRAASPIARAYAVWFWTFWLSITSYISAQWFTVQWFNRP